MAKFASILNASDFIIAPGVYDALSAKLTENAGFTVAWVSGFSVCTSLFLPDNNSLTIDQYISRIAEIRRASGIHLIVDCDEGFGDISKTMKLFDMLSDLNVECCCIEDNVYPKSNSFDDTKLNSKKIKDMPVFANTISTLKKSFPEIMLVARTEALIAGEKLDSAVERARAYRSAGADLAVIHSGSKTYAEFEQIANRFGDPASLAVIPTLAQNMSAADFRNIGYKIAIYANQILRNNISTTNKVLGLLRDQVDISALNANSVTMDYIFRMIESGAPALTDAGSSQ